MRPIARCLAFCLICSTASADDWPAFRGPGSRGISAETGIPLHWGAGQNVKWETRLESPGNGSPIVCKGRIFLVGSTDQGRKRSLHCFDRQDGREIWVQTVEFDAVEPTHQTSPHGAVTPVTDGERVVVWHGSAGIYCYDYDGNLQWSRDLGKFHHIWGYASSPILHDGKVIQFCGPGERQFVAALDLKSGEVLWETPEPGGSASDKGKYIGSWASPLVIHVDGQDQILVGLPTRVAAYDPKDGKIIWYVEGIAGENGNLMYTTPMVSDGFCVALGGFGGPAMGFTLGGQGNVTETNRKWRHDRPRNPQRIGSGMIVGEHYYIANADNQGSIECREVRTGQQRWEVRRTSSGPHWASMLMADGRLYATGQRGVTRVFEPDPTTYKELAVNDLGGRTHATPAISDGEIFIRTWDKLYCISGEPQPPATPRQQ
jgi:outer membrane protein assembly factor BamB